MAKRRKLADKEEIDYNGATVFEADPYQESKAATTSYRRNQVSTDPAFNDTFTNIANSYTPFSSTVGATDINIKDISDLLQKAYYNFGVFRNTVDTMTEFSAGDLFFKGGNAKSKKFFKDWMEGVNMWDLQNQFYREYFRSGNVFVYKQEGQISKQDLKNLEETFNLALSAEAATIPIRYILLNPIDITFRGSLSFSNGKYYKLLSDFEVSNLKKPKTLADKQMFDGLPEDIKKEIVSAKGSTQIYLELNPDYIYTIFYKKQSYEPFSVGPFFPVLESLSFKAELQKIDLAIARKISQAILLVTAGAPPDKGGINHNNLKVLQQIFENQSVGRVLVSDYTTKAEWVIPAVGDLLTPAKYEIVNKDIQNCLFSIFAGGDEKFANQQTKVSIFIEKLKQARKTFINDFLTPEIKRIATQLGFRSYPTVYYSDPALTDELQYAKIYTRLCELGILTPDETLEAMETGTLPAKEDSRTSQEEFKKLRKQELYMPLATFNGQKGVANNGRPQGTKAPQTTKNVKPIGAKEQYSIANLKEAAELASQLETAVLKKIGKGKKTVSPEQKTLSQSIAELIISNEPKTNWINSIDQYINQPIDQNQDRVNRILDIAAQTNLSTQAAAILYASEE